jgi:cell division protein FtsQ
MGLFGLGKTKRGASPKRRPRAERVDERKLAQRQKAKRHQKLEQLQKAERKQKAEQLKQQKSAQKAQGQRNQPLFGWPRAERKSAAPARQARGEPRAKGKAREPAAPLPWRKWIDGAVPVLAVALVGALLAGGWWMLHYVGSVPVSRVLFTGDLRHVDRDELVARVQPLLVGEGFMTADLDAIRTTLKQLPWVAEVSVQRRWPSQLVVAVAEQEPIARWGEDGLLNRHGQVFRPQPLGEVSELPVLFGPDELAADVVARYAELSQLLAEQGLKLASLGTDRRGSWRAELQGGITLRLGTGDALAKLRRFVRVYRSGLEQQFAQVAYVDLRYSNGLAVGWNP